MAWTDTRRGRRATTRQPEAIVRRLRAELIADRINNDAIRATPWSATFAAHFLIITTSIGRDTALNRTPASRTHGYCRRARASMIQTPPSFAVAPDNDHDVLAESLRAVRLTGSVFLDACFTAPFGIISPKRFDAYSPMAHLRHVSVFHLVAAGE